MSYLLLDEALELLEAAVDEGLHEFMAVYCVLDDEGNFDAALATSEGLVPLAEVHRAIAAAFRHYATVDRCEES